MELDAQYLLKQSKFSSGTNQHFGYLARKRKGILIDFFSKILESGLMRDAAVKCELSISRINELRELDKDFDEAIAYAEAQGKETLKETNN